tara:strand:+ start:2953 stop:3612 length:660 start_codon:yes stop_codon:yes gene_type:complete
MSGWIKIDRRISEHWIYNDSWKFRNWIDLILMVNHRDNKIEIDGTLFMCKRGETLRSIQTLSTRWRCSKSKVRRFLQLLQKDSMIELKNEIKTTRITICKYDTYQIDGIKVESKTKRKRNASESDADPNKNEKNEKKKNFQKNLEPYLEKFGADMIEDFFLYWTEETPKGEMRWETMKAFSLGRRLGTWNKNLIQRQSESGADDYQSNVMKQMRGGGHE